MVGKINKALVDANPVQQDPALIRQNRIVELDSVYKSRVEESNVKYKARMKKMSAAYTRLASEGDVQSDPVVTRDSTTNDDDDGLIEYVFSPLKVALPQRQDSKTPIEALAFQPLIYSQGESDDVYDHGVPEPTGTLSITHTAVPGPGGGRTEPKDPRWDQKLYSTLRLDGQSIRLVDILPGKKDDDVFVSIGVHHLSAVAMEYEALSYVWGDPKPERYIFVSKVDSGIHSKLKVPVGPNLHDALLSLRHEKSSRRIWIDAICLNQASNAEKSREVRKMGEIYRMAKTVILFLGAPSHSTVTWMESLFRFLNRSTPELAGGPYAKDKLIGLDQSCVKCQTKAEDVGKGFIEACLQPWWGRLWTLVSFDFLSALLSQYFQHYTL